jgi:hypothetical protein
MFASINQQAKKNVCLGIILILASFVIATACIGCSAWVYSTAPNSSAAANFAYSGSRLMSTVASANGPVAISGTYFGMTIHRLVANPLSAMPSVQFPAFPIHTLRLWDVVSWSSLEPANGQFDWTTMDGTIAVAKQNHVSDFIFTMGYVPSWASTQPSDPCGPGATAGSCDAPNMEAFDSFVTQLVQRYCGVVQYYETWNEPNLSYFWNGTDAQLLNLAGNLYKIAKDPANCGCTNGACSPGGGANPNQVLLPSINSINDSDLDWLDTYLATAGPTYPYADIATFHGYGYTQPEGIVQGVAQLRQTLTKHGLASLELWDTEASWGITAAGEQEQQASWLMRFHIAQAVSGVSRFVWYAYDNCIWGSLWGSLCGDSPDNWQGIRLPGEAYANLEDWIVGATLTHCEQYENGLWACELQRPGGYEGWILWSSNGATLTIPIPASSQLTQYRDWQNNITPLPAELAVNQMQVLVEN